MNRRIFQRIDTKFRRFAFQSTQKSFLNPRVFIQSSRFSLQSARFFFNPHVFLFNPHVFSSIRTFCLQLKNAKYKSTPSWGKIFLGDFNYITVTLSVTFSVTPKFSFNEKYLTFQKPNSCSVLATSVLYLFPSFGDFIFSWLQFVTN